MPLEDTARALVIVGLLVVAVGLLCLIGSRVPFLGRLPGDLYWEHDGLTVYAPLATGLLVSVVLSVLLTLVLRLTGRGE